MKAISSVQFGMRVLWLVLGRRFVDADDIRDDYNRLCRTYDDCFGSHVSRHSQRLIERLPIARGMRVVDLAAGTGTLTVPLAQRVGADGHVTSVDRSAGMQTVCRRKCREGALAQVAFVENDMLAALKTLPEGEFDGVTCGWAIGYSDPVELLCQAQRILKPGGFVGIIENARHTLHPVRATALRVARTLPRHVARLMDLHRRLPRDTEHLASWFRRAGLKPRKTWDGNEPFTFRSGREVLDWVLRTGASAGFDRMMDPAVKQTCDRLFAEYIEQDHMRDGRIDVAHCYVAGIAGKEA